MIDKEAVIARLRALYEEKRGYVWDGYTAPEMRPQISRQVISLAEAMVEAVNEQHEDVLSEIDAHDNDYEVRDLQSRVDDIEEALEVRR